MTRYLLARIRKRYQALWVSLVYMEPLGSPTWCVWVHDPRVGITPRAGHDEVELGRSRSRLIAAWLAFTFRPSTP